MKLNKPFIYSVTTVLCFFAAILFAHISASTYTGGLCFFYMIWSCVFSVGAILSAIEVCDAINK